MASKELINKVAISSGITKRQAEAAISTILAALQEPTERMFFAGSYQLDDNGDYNASHVWLSMLNASPLGEQSE